jgi:CheY-like chemotaxis protein
MSETKARLLIVDDEPSIRMSMSLVLAEIGYPVRSAADGFSALVEIRHEAPDILVSDLNMPGMSGFELLSVVRRRYPAIKVIAMSGAFSGDEVPSGVAADAFYQKGSSIGSLLRIMESLPQPERILPRQPDPSEPIWIQSVASDSSGEAHVTIACPECLRTFTQPLDSSANLLRETNCINCHTSIHYAIHQSTDQMPLQAFSRKPSAAVPGPQGAQNHSYGT